MCFDYLILIDLDGSLSNVTYPIGVIIDQPPIVCKSSWNLSTVTLQVPDPDPIQHVLRTFEGQSPVFVPQINVMKNNMAYGAWGCSLRTLLSDGEYYQVFMGVEALKITYLVSIESDDQLIESALIFR